MSDGLTVTYKVYFEKSERHKQQRVLKVGERPDPETLEEPPPGCIPRISRLMALALRFDKLIRDGVVDNFAQLAKLGQVTRARITQIMNMLLLAPDIQEEILFLPKVHKGRDKIRERQVRHIAAVVSWSLQRKLWEELKEKVGVTGG